MGPIQSLVLAHAHEEGDSCAHQTLCTYPGEVQGAAQGQDSWPSPPPAPQWGLPRNLSSSSDRATAFTVATRGHCGLQVRPDLRSLTCRVLLVPD